MLHIVIEADVGKKLPFDYAQGPDLRRWSSEAETTLADRPSTVVERPFDFAQGPPRPRSRTALRRWSSVPSTSLRDRRDLDQAFEFAQAPTLLWLPFDVS
jgi:hypothetical protein